MSRTMMAFLIPLVLLMAGCASQGEPTWTPGGNVTIWGDEYPIGPVPERQPERPIASID